MRSRSRSLVALAAVGALVLVAAAAGCADRGRVVDVVEPARGTDGRGVDAPVVIVTVDGVRWQEVFEGTDLEWAEPPQVPGMLLAPALHLLGTQRGAFIGAPGRGVIAASGPNFISLPGYLEILSGRPSGTCTSNDCPRTTLPTILDEARASGARVAAFSSWEQLAFATTANPGAFQVSCGRSGDSTIDPWPGYKEYRPDAITADLALDYFETEQPDVFFLGLGDPDEFAHRGDYARYIVAIRRADDIIARLVGILARTGDRGRRTHVIITADHGRSRAFKDHGTMPEAARVWLVATGPRFAARGAVHSKRERRLADLAPTLRVVLGLAPDTTAGAGSVLDELFERDDTASPAE